MTSKRRSTWKLERASVTTQERSRARTNKFAETDQSRRPRPHTRKKVWIGGYVKSDGTEVRGHFRSLLPME